jgi:hypothetical protein
MRRPDSRNVGAITVTVFRLAESLRLGTVHCCLHGEEQLDSCLLCAVLARAKSQLPTTVGVSENLSDSNAATNVFYEKRDENPSL